MRDNTPQAPRDAEKIDGESISLGMYRFRIADPSKLAKDFLEKSLERGLGAPTKKESEILLLHLFLRHTGAWERPLHELSLVLKIPESRLSNIIYEMRLKYANENDVFLGDYLLAMFARAKFPVLPGPVISGKETQRVEISVEDKFVRQRILADLRSMGVPADSGQEKDLLRVDIDCLAQLFIRYLDEGAKSAISMAIAKELSSVKKSAARAKGVEKKGTLNEDLISSFLKGAAQQTGAYSVDIAAAVASGGASLASSFGIALGKFLKA